jgi:hypothetical protein
MEWGEARTVGGFGNLNLVVCGLKDSYDEL